MPWGRATSSRESLTGGNNNILPLAAGASFYFTDATRRCCRFREAAPWRPSLALQIFGYRLPALFELLSKLVG